MKRKNRQQGATLITALVMLVVLTLLVISAIRSSTINLRIAGNMQIKEENVAGAQVASEEYISNNFSKYVSTINPVAATGTANIGGTSYATEVKTPVCLSTIELPPATPNLPSGCISGGGYSQDGNTGLSCMSQVWDVKTTATDPVTGAQVIQHQGVSLTVSKDSPCK